MLPEHFKRTRSAITMIRLYLLLSVAGFVFVWTPLQAQNPVRQSERALAIDRIVRAYHELGHFDGVVLVAVGGHKVYEGAFGEANREWGNPHTMEGRFRIGSITKAFTGMLALRLVESGKLRLDARVSDYLADLSPRFGDRVTIGQLLTHTSGLPDFNSFPDFFQQVQAGLMSQKDVLNRIGQYDLLSPPGTKFSYSNDGYVLLGAIIGRVTNASYERALEQLVLTPADMRSTGVSTASQILPFRVDGYRRILGGFENVIPYAGDPAAGLYSTAGDLFKWDEALYRDEFVSKNIKDRMWALSPYGNAYGWLVSRKVVPGVRDSVLVIKGDGAVPGFYALTLRIPRDHIFVVALTNNRGPKNYLPDIAERITNILYGGAVEPPVRSLADYLRANIPRGGASQVIADYKALALQSEKFELDRNHINSVGYALLRAERPKDAVAVFQLNRDLFPLAANVYDSLGDGLAALGERVEAIANFTRALQLDSTLTETRVKLQKLQQIPY